MVRLLSASALIVVIVGIIWGMPWWVTVAAAVVVAWLAGNELAAMAASIGVAPLPRGFVGLAAGLACAAFVIGHPLVPVFRENALSGCLLGILLASSLVALASGPPVPSTMTRVGVMALGPLYVGLPLGALAWTQAVVGPAALTWLLVVIALSDSAQYYTGRLFGRRKLAPIVSPAKTVEGAAGGLVVAALVGAALAGWALPETHPAVAGSLALVLATMGICGDLFESLLKRSAGVKDSSSIIPGHGGVLDRIDAYLFAGPLFYLFLSYLA